MPRRHSRVIESDTEEDINISSNSESEYTDTDSDYDNINNVIDNDISDEEFNKEENDSDSDVNLLSNELFTSSISEKSLTNKTFEECYEELNKFFKENVYNYSPEKKDKKTKEIIQEGYYVKNDKKYYDITFEKNEDGSFSIHKNGIKDTYEVYLRCQYIVRKDYSFLFIKLSEYETFLILLNNVINNPNIKKSINYNKYKLDIIETYTLIVPLLIDIDYHYIDKYDGRRLYEEIIDIILKEIELLVRNHYNLDIYDDKLNIYVYSKDSISDNPKNNDKKDGFHIGIYIPILLTDYMGIHNEFVEKLSKYDIINEWFKKYDIKTTLDDFIDTHLKDRPYMMTGCTKYLPENNYKPSPVYNLDLKRCRCDNIENLKKYSVIKSSVAQFYLKKTEPLKLIKPFNTLLKLSSSSDEKPKSKKQKIDNDNEIDLDTPTQNKKYNYTSKKEINDRYTYEDLEKGVNLWNYQYIKEDDKKEIKELKEQKNKIFYNNIRDEKGWLFNACSLLSWFDDKKELENKKWILINKFSMKLPEFDYDLDNNKKVILSSYKKDKYNCVNINHFWDNCKEFNEEETLNIINNAYKRNSQNKLIQYEDINEVKTLNYNILFDKESNFNPYKFDKLFEKNIIDAIKYFYNYYVYIGSDVFYKLVFKYEYGRKIYDFQEIKSNKYLDLNLKKELTKEEIEYINNYNEFGYHRIKNAIKVESKKQKIYCISFYNALDTTKTFFTSKCINDITQNLYYGIKGLNKYNIQVSNNLFFNENNLKRCLYFDDILNTNININENDNYLQLFKYYIDNYIIKRTADDNDFNLIEQKRFYIYNYLKTIFNFKKNHTCLILLGGQGTMKSTLGKMIISTISNKIGRCLTGSEFLNETYNGSILEDALFVQLEELKVAENGYQHNDMINNLKNIITADELRIRKILKNPEFKKTFISYLITSNFNCPLKISYDDRRYVVMEINNKCDDDKFITRLNKLFENKDGLTSLYNYFKNTNFTCKCNDKNCLYHNFNDENSKPFEHIEGILTPEKRRIIQGTSNIFEQFEVDFYYQIKYDMAKNKLLNNKSYIIYDKDDINNSKFHITISKFYGEFKNYLELKKINKIPKKSNFSQSLINGLFNYSSKDNTEIINISINDYRNLLFKNSIIDIDDDYIFIDNEGEFINEGNFKPFNPSLIIKEY